MAITQLTFYPNSINYYGFDPTAEPSVSGNGYACSGGESTGPAYDLLDNRRSSVVTFDTNGETTAANVLTQPTSTISNCDFAIFDNHNMKTAGAKIYIYDEDGSAKLAITSSKSGALGSALAADSVGSDIITIGTDGMTLVKYSVNNFKNAGFTLNIDDVSTFAADVTLGEMVYGKSFTPSCNPELNGIDGGGLYGGITLNETKAGIRSAVKQYGERKYWSFTFTYVTEAQLAEYRRIWQETKGYPFYFSENSDSATLTLYRVRLMNDFNPELTAFGAYSLTMELEAEL